MDIVADVNVNTGTVNSCIVHVDISVSLICFFVCSQ